jgi:NAD(P)-dependent dehydrogenase (short-subunit alcohol dehydrogenase family)
MNTVAIVGDGDLAQAWISKNKKNYTINVYGHQEFDLTQKNHCDQLIDVLQDKDIIIITAGVFDKDLWNIWLVNLVAPSYIVSELIKKDYKGKTVVISSNAANWTSWPEISLERLVYNNSKHAISKFVYGTVQSGHGGQFVVLEPSKFKSSMSQQQGQDIESVVDAIDFSIKNNYWNIKF